MRLQVALITVLLSPALSSAQLPQLTADDYARAERFLAENTTPLVFGDAVRPSWTEDGRFWYSTATPDGTRFFLVDPVSRSKGEAFDHVLRWDASSGEVVLVAADGSTDGIAVSGLSALVIRGGARDDVLALDDTGSDAPISITFDGRAGRDAIARRGADAIIPPRRNAKPWKGDSPGAAGRNDAPRAIRRLGRTVW